MIFFSNVQDQNVPGKNLLPPLVLFALLVGVGVAFAIHALFVGHDHVFGTSREVPWGILITPYVFFACLSTGICIISSLGQVFGIKTLAPLVNRTVFLAIIAMAAGLMSIGLEIENPWNMAIFGFLSPNPLSNIWWKSSIYTLFLLLMAFNFMFLLMGRGKTAWGFALGALVAITCGNLNMNSDMALLGSRGFWAENYMPLFFLTVSTLSASCMIILLTWLSSWLQNSKVDTAAQDAMSALFKLTMALLVGVLCFAAMKALGGFSTKFTDNPEAMQLLVRGEFAVNFWLGEIGLAIVLPLILLLASNGGKRTGLYALACLSILIGIAVTFYDLIIVGQLIPHFHQYDLFGYPSLYSYSPTLHEYMMVTGSVSFFLAAFLGGELIFNSLTLERWRNR
ncbi:NrfD/PsrC family molybdoenzyme membrane anchor subunit [Desulfopila aestuarii]|uniref:Prokaryotic molybdopterin-containing oxidoreductase family, membrane subunit n=1 Tax=Desulfopila aestuarii DSM 18488 TaxID=1121416 RepID=A0A1M7Y853_9BACT|nr:NrfD/PsrC family molybdoenzyme membrane anchor subunit [Desulfopila aestuarii]SHO48824.1 prokaryotic molybdopterin-containing oxidoreductase family, membrane subunit [Desulfopila aestuarii DSM 18488]